MKEFHGEYKGEALATVNSTNTAAAVGSGSLPVFATPMMLALTEKTRRLPSTASSFALAETVAPIALALS